MRALLELQEASDDPEPEGLDAQRAAYDAEAETLGGEPAPVGALEEPADAPVALRSYTPASGPARGVVVFLHGGGWATGSLDSHDRVCRRLANGSGARVVAVGYRLAPEHPFPAGLEDAEAALGWVAARWPDEPLAVAGDSAGGNLATVLARRARDAGGPELRLQGLVYPVCDAAMETASYDCFCVPQLLTREGMAEYFERYGGEAADPDVSPLRAGDLRGLAPAYVLTASHDILRDEGEAYAARLREAGVPVTLRRWEGVIHGFLRWTGPVQPARDAVCELGAQLRRALTDPGHETTRRGGRAVSGRRDAAM